MTEQIKANRKLFLEALRSGHYKKGTIKSDLLGNPIIKSVHDEEGYCACAIMMHLFPSPVSNSGKQSTLPSRQALGLTRKQCGYIQQELNDTSLSFIEIADRIESGVFN